MESPPCHFYGGTKKKRNQDDCLRSNLDAHIREHLNLKSLRTQDRKWMAWTLGDLAYFCYKSVVAEQYDGGVPAVEALHHIHFSEAARHIASERGVLERTSDDVLERVSLSMAKRFAKSHLPEALESFIAKHSPAPCKTSARALQEMNARSQRSIPLAAQQGNASAAAAVSDTGSHPSSATSTSENAGAASGPSQIQSVQFEQCAGQSASHDGGRLVSFRMHDAPSAVTEGLPTKLKVEDEEQETGPVIPNQPDGWRSTRRCHDTQTWGSFAASAMRPCLGQDPTIAARAEKPREAAPQGPTNLTTLSAAPFQDPAVDQAPGLSTLKHTVAADTARAGNKDSGAKTCGIPLTSCGGAKRPAAACGMTQSPNFQCEGTNGDRDMGPQQGELNMHWSEIVKYDRQAVLRLLTRGNPTWPSAELRQRQPLPAQPSQQQHWQHPQQTSHQCHWHAASLHNHIPDHSRPPGPSSGGPHCPDPPHGADRLPMQPHAGSQESGGKGTYTAAAVDIAARSATNREHEQNEFQQQHLHVQGQQQHSQGQQQGQGQHQVPGQQQEQGQGALQPPQRQQACPRGAEEVKQQQSQQQQAPTPSLKKQSSGRLNLLSQLRLARKSVDGRMASASTTTRAVWGSVSDPARPSTCDQPVVHVQSPAAVAGGASGAAAAAAGHLTKSTGPSGAAETTAGGTLPQSLFSLLRRDYDKRLAKGALEMRLRKHLRKNGNTTIRQYCIKEGMPWTLLEVACYGVALQQLASQPFGVDSAIHFLARVKGWRPASNGVSTTAAGADEARGLEELPRSLVHKVAAVMEGAISKYNLLGFIECQHRNKPRPRPRQQQQQQQQHDGPPAVAEEPGNPERLDPTGAADVSANATAHANAHSANAVAVPGGAATMTAEPVASAGFQPEVTQQNTLPSYENVSYPESIGVSAAAAAGHLTKSTGPSGAAETTAGGTLPQSLFSLLRRDYDKRLAKGALEMRLRKHLCKNGNTTIRQYCIKEGMPWTLLEVACYGVALQQLASQPFEVDSAIHFLARVKGWRPASNGVSTAAAGAEEARGLDELPRSLVHKVAAVMEGAISKYNLLGFIECQHRNKPRPRPRQQQQQQQHDGPPAVAEEPVKPGTR
ncbi:hypothetical protein VaNZ11_014546 [Volvox africanus]|uniref:Uncharacterized protein n=1 Tax=Volvox africanus TaxID=51714 RepID=A0ABQ5SKA5_9CHLO|nr:hypothetical protein VaNZ11_014546 [Volvox africanus]